MLLIFGPWISLKNFDDASMKTVFILMSMILNKIDWNIEFYFICYRTGKNMQMIDGSRTNNVFKCVLEATFYIQ